MKKSENLAKVAERERIARDLHDVLAIPCRDYVEIRTRGKMMDRDPQQAGKEIREVEQISRQALSEVRECDSRISFPGTGGRIGPG